MLKELQDLGLSEKEAKIYLAALEIGRATADQLAKAAKIVRPTAYVQIKSLMEKGLMSTYDEGKKTYFAPESPEALRRVLDLEKERITTREHELTRLLPGLLQQFESAGERPVVRFYTGKAGIVSLREESLQTKEKKLYILSSNDHLAEVFSKEERAAFSENRADKGIKAKILYTRAAGKVEGDVRENTERAHLSPTELPLATDIVIFDDEVAIITLKGRLIGVLIKSKEIQESMLALFNFLWAKAEKH